MSGANAHKFSQFPGDSRIWIGLETQRAGSGYRWRGLNRASGRPEILLQVTLAGSGRFRTRGRTVRIAPGKAFFAVIPSDHEYWMPEQGEDWTYFWMMIEHPYVITRFASLTRGTGCVLDFSDSDPAFLATIGLFTRTARGEFPNEGEQERAVLDWMIALAQHRQNAPSDPAHAMLHRFEFEARKNLNQPLGVSQLAAKWGMSRTHFSHTFRRLTGRSPGQALLAVRINEALRLLADPTLSVAEVAAKCGFADSAHLGKIFRARWGVPPGRFRKQRFGIG